MVIELSAEEQARLSEMAAKTNRTTEQLAREALHWLVEPDEEHARSVAAAREDIAHGRTTDHDVLFAEIERQLSE